MSVGVRSNSLALLGAGGGRICEKRVEGLAGTVHRQDAWIRERKFGTGNCGKDKVQRSIEDRCVVVVA